MAGPRSQDVLRHSILDRLAGVQVGSDPRIGLQDLKAAVLRDVEWLLNSKYVMDRPLDELPETAASIMTYGLPDFMHFSGSSLSDCKQVCGLIEHTLRTFEPRLAPRSIKVEFVDRDDEVGLHTHFRIHALLHVDPFRESIVFDTTIEMDTGAIAVRMSDL